MSGEELVGGRSVGREGLVRVGGVGVGVGVGAAVRRVVVEPYLGEPKVRRSVKGRVEATCKPALVCRGQSKLNGTRLVTIKVESAQQ